MAEIEAMNLWPSDLPKYVKSPKSILKSQAELLTQITDGILFGELGSKNGPEIEVLDLSIFAPALNSKYTILEVHCRADLPYPATLFANKAFHGPEGTYKSSAEASDEKKFVELLSEVLRSKETLSIVSSLIARSNGE